MSEVTRVNEVRWFREALIDSTRAFECDSWWPKCLNDLSRISNGQKKLPVPRRPVMGDGVRVQLLRCSILYTISCALLACIHGPTSPCLANGSPLRIPTARALIILSRASPAPPGSPPGRHRGHPRAALTLLAFGTKQHNSDDFIPRLVRSPAIAPEPRGG